MNCFSPNDLKDQLLDAVTKNQQVWHHCFVDHTCFMSTLRLLRDSSDVELKSSFVLDASDSRLIGLREDDFKEIFEMLIMSRFQYLHLRYSFDIFCVSFFKALGEMSESDQKVLKERVTTQKLWYKPFEENFEKWLEDEKKRREEDKKKWEEWRKGMEGHKELKKEFLGFRNGLASSLEKDVNRFLLKYYGEDAILLAEALTYRYYDDDKLVQGDIDGLIEATIGDERVLVVVEAKSTFNFKTYSKAVEQLGKNIFTIGSIENIEELADHFICLEGKCAMKTHKVIGFGTTSQLKKPVRFDGTIIVKSDNSDFVVADNK